MKIKPEKTFKKTVRRIIFLPVYLFVAGFFFASYVIVSGLSHSYISQNNQLAKEISFQVQEYLDDRSRELDGVIRVTEKIDPSLENETLFANVASMTEHFEKIEIFDHSGAGKLEWPAGETENSDSAPPDSFQSIPKGQSFYWSSPFLSDLTGHMAIKMTRPFFSGIVQGTLDLSHLGVDLQRLAVNSDASVMLVDSRGNILVQLDGEVLRQKSVDLGFVSALGARKEGMFNYFIERKKNLNLVSAQVLDNANWYVLSVKPIEKIYGPMIPILVVLLPLLVIVLLGAFALSRLVERQLIQALENLRNETKKIAEGDYSQSITRTRYRDLNEILEDFERMRESVWMREQDLRDSEYRFRRMFEEAAVGIIHTTFEGIPLDLNLAMARMLGYSTPQEALPYLQSFETGLYVRPEERVAMLQMLRSSQHGKIQVETEFFTRTKSVLIVNIYLGRVFDAHRSEFILEAFVEDVTEIKTAEREIRELNQELERKVQERTQHLEKALEDLNAAQDQLVQAEKMAALGHLIAGIAHEINTPLGAISASNDNILALLKKVLDSLPWILQVITLEQRALFYKMYESANREIQLLSSSELRQRRRKAQQVLEANGFIEEREMIDNLAELGLVDQLQEYLPLLRDPLGRDAVRMINEMISLEKSCAIIDEASEKAAKVINALRTFAHQDITEESNTMHIVEGLDTVLTLFQNRLKHGVEVVTRMTDPGKVWGNPDKLNQVWTNLISNALQAMEYRGTLEIEVREDNGFAKVCVIDSGPGIPEEIRSRIFQPFFTTKKAGEGSGLGLDICQKIVREHKGTIEFESRPGRTMFIVRIPLIPPEEGHIG